MVVLAHTQTLLFFLFRPFCKKCNAEIKGKATCIQQGTQFSKHCPKIMVSILTRYVMLHTTGVALLISDIYSKLSCTCTCLQVAQRSSAKSVGKTFSLLCLLCKFNVCCIFLRIASLSMEITWCISFKWCIHTTSTAVNVGEWHQGLHLYKFFQPKLLIEVLFTCNVDPHPLFVFAVYTHCEIRQITIPCFFSAEHTHNRIMCTACLTTMFVVWAVIDLIPCLSQSTKTQK